VQRGRHRGRGGPPRIVDDSPSQAGEAVPDLLLSAVVRGTMWFTRLPQGFAAALDYGPVVLTASGRDPDAWNWQLTAALSSSPRTPGHWRAGRSLGTQGDRLRDRQHARRSGRPCTPELLREAALGGGEPSAPGPRLHAARRQLPTTHRHHPRALAAFRNLVISAFRLAGRANIAHARRDLHDRNDAFNTFGIWPRDQHQPDTSQQRRGPGAIPTASSKSREPLVTYTFVVPSGRVGTAA
jgi:hypothetical protein